MRRITDSFISFLRGFLLAFGGIALSSARSSRELALDHDRAAHPGARTLRTLGASRRQVLRSIIVEALVMGTLASLVGLFLGLLIPEGPLRPVRPRRVHPPEHRARVPDADLGDRGAARRDPGNAGREPAARDPRDARPPDRGGSRGLRAPAAEAPAAARHRRGAHRPSGGVAAIAYGVFAHGLGTKQVLTWMGLGTLLMFLGVSLFSSRLVRPLARILGAGPRRGGRRGGGARARQRAPQPAANRLDRGRTLMIGF